MQKNINWNIIYTEYSPKLLGICRRYVRDLASAEDIIQESFINAIEKQTQLKNENALFSWLKRIVINNALQYLQTNGGQLFSEIDTEHLKYEEESDESDFLSRKFSAKELLTCIDELPVHHKTVFNLFFLENYSHEEISKELGININTSKSHLLRAKKSLKNKLMEKHTKPSFLKKKGVQLLVFLGLGNLLWAKNLQSSFSDYTVQPKKDFRETLANAKPLQVESETKKTFTLNNKIIFALCFFVGLLFFVFTSNSILPKNDYSENETKITNPISELEKQSTEPNEGTIETEQNTNPVENKTSTPILAEHKKTEKANPKKQAFSATENKEQKPLLTTNTNTENKKTNTEKIQDSATTSKSKKPVIVVKKTIKRDTIYIRK